MSKNANGASPQSGKAASASSAEQRSAVTGSNNGDPEAGNQIATRTEGFSLFGSGPQTQEGLSERLARFMKGENPDEEAESTASTEVQTEPEAGGESRDGSATGDNGEEEGEGQESAEGAEGEGEADEESEEQEPQSGQWPKGAIEAISEQRRRRREAESELTKFQDRVAELESRLESEELKRPIAPTPENPLAFADTPEKLAQWEKGVRGMLGLIDDQLEGDLDESGRAKLEAWAKQNGAWDSEAGDFNRSILKREKRMAQEALQEHAPARREFFQREKAYVDAVGNDPVLSPVWKDRNSQEYKDAMGVLQTVPGIRALPQWKAAAAIYALGLKAYRELQPGKEGSGKGQSATGTATAAKVPAVKKVPAGKKVASLPGRSAVVPRNVESGAAAAKSSLEAKVRNGTATTADYEELTRANLMGKIAVPG